MKLTQATPDFVARRSDTGNHYPVYVEAPAGACATGPLPSIVLMDGDFVFDMARQVARDLIASGRVPPFVLAAVGYGAGFGQPGNHRVRDYTPTPFIGEPESGGAEAFVQFLCRELWPTLAGRHNLDPQARGIGGHSLGSLLALHAVFRKDPFFRTGWISSPSVWWDDRSILGSVSRLRQRHDRLDARLYLSVGESDTPSMTGDLALLRTLLEESPFDGLSLVWETFAGRDHYNVVEDALGKGLVAVLT